VANVFENRIDTRDVMEMNFTPKEYERFKLEPEDILLNEGQSKELIGRPAMFMGELEGVCFTNTLVRFRAYPPISAPYAMLVFRHYFRSGLFQSIANITTNIAHLGAGRFADLPFPLPPLAEQAEIVKRCSVKVRAVEIVGSHVSKALAQIERFEQATLAKAFRGELVGLRKSGGPVPFRNGVASNG
jgi:type I restriction enzyme S subunit